jgi:hypothetical protein
MTEFSSDLGIILFYATLSSNYYLCKRTPFARDSGGRYGSGLTGPVRNRLLAEALLKKKDI